MWRVVAAVLRRGILTPGMVWCHWRNHGWDKRRNDRVWCHRGRHLHRRASCWRSSSGCLSRHIPFEPASVVGWQRRSRCLRSHLLGARVVSSGIPITSGRCCRISAYGGRCCVPGNVEMLVSSKTCTKKTCVDCQLFPRHVYDERKLTQDRRCNANTNTCLGARTEPTRVVSTTNTNSAVLDGRGRARDDREQAIFR